MDDISRNSVMGYLNSIRTSEQSYRFSSYSNATLLSTSFAVSLRNSLGSTFEDSERGLLKDYFVSSQREDGMFVDSAFDEVNNLTAHKNDYIIPQFTYFSLIALDILGVQIRELKFMEEFLQASNLERWLNDLDWGRFWYESNKIMFLLYFLAYTNKYDKATRAKQAATSIGHIIAAMNDKQDRSTGLWGQSLNSREGFYDGLYGAAHIYLYYDYFNQDINYPEKIIDSALMSHTESGLVQTMEGGACEDYDAIEIYLRTLKHSSHKRSEVIEKITQMERTIIQSQHRNGGFPYKIYSKSSLLARLFFSPPKQQLYKYSSWDFMTTPVYYPDVWATFFRTLSLGAISILRNGNTNLQSYTLPGWGYL